FLIYLSRRSTYAATTELSTLSLHDALPISIKAAGILVVRQRPHDGRVVTIAGELAPGRQEEARAETDALIFGEQIELVDLALLGDRKSTRLNSSHVKISYAVFCLKKKKKKK